MMARGSRPRFAVVRRCQSASRRTAWDSWKHSKGLLVYENIEERRWCHAGIGWVGRLGRASKRCGYRHRGATSQWQPQTRAGQGCTSDAPDLRFGLPTCALPATARQIPTVSLFPPRGALETSFSLARLPNLCLNHSTCTIVFTPRTTSLL
jgi:hypothetical protein